MDLIKLIVNEGNAHKLLNLLLSEGSKATGSKLLSFIIRNAITKKVVRYIAIKLVVNLFKAPTPKVFIALLHKLISLGFSPSGKAFLGWIVSKMPKCKAEDKAKLIETLKSPAFKGFYSRCLDEMIPNKLLRKAVRFAIGV